MKQNRAKKLRKLRRRRENQRLERGIQEESTMAKAEAPPKKPSKPFGGPWLKLYRQFRDNGLTVEEARRETEKVLGPMPKGTILKVDLGVARTESFDTSIEVLKVDEALGLVMGFAIISKIDGEPYHDLQGDYIPEQEMLRASMEFMEKSRLADEMHDYKNKGTVVFAFPLTSEIAKAFDLSSKVTGLMIAMRPSDPAMLQRFKDGTLTGFSIGGRGFRTEVVE